MRTDFFGFVMINCLQVEQGGTRYPRKGYSATSESTDQRDSWNQLCGLCVRLGIRSRDRMSKQSCLCHAYRAFITSADVEEPMSLFKFCNPEHNVHRGSHVQVGTLFKYRDIEDAGLRDEH